MQNEILYVFLILGICVYIIYYKFSEKHYIGYDSSHKLPIDKVEFKPNTYVFINSKEDVKQYVNHLNQSKENEDIINDYLDRQKLDFTSHSYLIVNGAYIGNIYWSYKTTIFDCDTLSHNYIFNNGRHNIFVEDIFPNGDTYIFGFKKSCIYFYK